MVRTPSEVHYAPETLWMVGKGWLPVPNKNHTISSFGLRPSTLQALSLDPYNRGLERLDTKTLLHPWE